MLLLHYFCKHSHFCFCCVGCPVVSFISAVVGNDAVAVILAVAYVPLVLELMFSLLLAFLLLRWDILGYRAN
jgi:hypothetical protein